MQFRFADYVLDVERRELRRRGAPVDLEPQVFDLLVHLIRNPERVASRMSALLM
jgi:DNA-binding winged helix-turn-helix (wHTH) protein